MGIDLSSRFLYRLRSYSSKLFISFAPSTKIHQVLSICSYFHQEYSRPMRNDTGRLSSDIAVCLSVCLPACRSVGLSVSQSASLSVGLPVYPPVHLSVRRSVSKSVSVSVACPSVRPSVRRSDCLSRTLSYLAKASKSISATE